MKTIFTLALLASVSASPALAANGASDGGSPATVETVNAKAVSRFNADFQGATSIWNNEALYSEVLYFWHNNLMDAYYDKEGNLIGTFHDIKPAELPCNTLQQINDWYKKYTITSTLMMETENEAPTYYVTIQSPAHIRVLEVKSDGTVTEFKTLR